MTTPTPPVGAHVRHTTTYAEGLTITIEGHIVGLAGTEFSNPLRQQEHEGGISFISDPYGVTMEIEVLDVPGLLPEPPNGTVYVNGTLVWVRDDHLLDPATPWWGTGHDDGETWEVVAPLVTRPGAGWRRYIPDPADTAPALPWDVEDKDDDRLEIDATDVEGVAADVTINGDVSVYLGPAAAREAAGVLLRAAREFEERQR